MTDLPDALEELDTLLTAIPHPREEAFLLSELDGFLAGTLISPVPLAEEDWMPLIWSGDDGPIAGYVPPPRLVELIKARRSEIAGALLIGGLRYGPVYDYDTDDTPVWEIWAEGLDLAMTLWGDAWQETLLDDATDEDLASSLGGLMMLTEIAGGMPTKGDPMMREMEATAADMIPYLVEVVYRRQRGLERIVLD